MKELKVGIQFPILLLRCYRNEFDSKTLVGQKPCDLFYPKDNTPGCTADL
jgi:peroxiredoxin